MSETSEQLLTRRALARYKREHHARIAHRALDDIRARIRAIRERKAETLTRVRAHCKIARVRAREAAGAYRAAERERIDREVGEMLQAERNRCQARKERAKRGAETALETERREMKDERATQRLLRSFESRKRAELVRAASAAERRSESDDEVRGNLDPELVPVFDSVRRQIRARPGMSRTEGFLHWTHENPDEVWRIRGALAEAELAALVKEERRAWKEARKYKRPTRLESADLPPVPF